MNRRRARRPSRAAGPTLDVLLFPRDQWTRQDAQTWAQLNGYKWQNVTVTSSYVRIVQTSAKGKAGRAKVIPWAAGGVRGAVAWRDR